MIYKKLKFSIDIVFCLLVFILFNLKTVLADEAAALSKKTFINIAAMEMVNVQPGFFMMGSLESEKSRGRDEAPKKVVISEDFWISSTELTQKQWLEVMDISLQELIESKIGALGRGANLKKKPSAIADDQPMCFVSYFDALEFCQKLTEKERENGSLPEGFLYTLPTEAQWEFAARAGSKTVFCYGDSLTSNEANFYGKIPYGSDKEGTYREQTTAIKTFKPNAWGLYDMHGNVYEWCLDWYVEELPGGDDPVSLTEGDSRSIRGGAWNRKASSCRSAYRYSYDPTQRTNNIGFRVALVKAK